MGVRISLEEESKPYRAVWTLEIVRLPSTAGRRKEKLTVGKRGTPHVLYCGQRR